MWHVLNNGKPATMPELGWTNNKFDTVEEACRYLILWGYPYFDPESTQVHEIMKLCCGPRPYYFNGYGDTFHIVWKEESEESGETT